MGLYEKNMAINLKDYSNIGIDFYISHWLLLIFLVATLGILLAYFRKSCSLNLINELLDLDAVDEPCAENINNLSIRGISYKLAMSARKASRLVSTTKIVETVEDEQGKKTKNKSKMIYIREKRYNEALEFAESTSPTFGKSLLFILLMTSIYICIIFALPELLMFINNIL